MATRKLSGCCVRPGEVQQLLANARARGEIRFAGDANPIAKDGADAALLGKVRTQWMNVSPALAQQWLANNFRNRPVDRDLILSYARDMANGVWVPTHQGVAFNDRDELIDGQQRLQAIILSGCTVLMMVTFGLPSKIAGKEMTTMDAVDRGRTRSVADQLAIQHGMKHGKLISMLASSLAYLCCGHRTRRLTVGQTLDIYQVFRPSIDWIVLNRPAERGLQAVGVLVAFVFAREAGDAAAIETILGTLNAGTSAPKAPLSQLRRFLLSDEAKLLGRGADRGLSELVLAVLMHERLGHSMAKVEVTQAGVDFFKERLGSHIRSVVRIFELPGKLKACA